MDKKIVEEAMEILRGEPPYRDIFVFGSNRAGRHGAGAALYAKQHYGAINGQGEGLQGNSYAIPTKSSPYESLTLTEISEHVQTFTRFAEEHPDLIFYVTPIGCGLAGYKPMHIAPMFQNTPTNVLVPAIFSLFYDTPRGSFWDHTKQLLSPIVLAKPRKADAQTT